LQAKKREWLYRKENPMTQTSLCLWTTLIAVAILAGASAAETAAPDATSQAAAEPVSADRQDDPAEPAADEPSADEVQGPLPVQPDGNAPPEDEQIQGFLRSLKDRPRPEFDPSDFAIAPGSPTPADEARHPSCPPEDEDRTPWPWRQAQLRPQEGLTRWLDFDAYEDDPFMLDYDVRYYPRGGVVGQPGRLDMARHHFAAGMQQVGYGLHGINTRINWLELASDATLPDGRKLPSRLIDAQVEFFVPWFLPWSEFSIAFGSASDKPFASGDEMFVDITWLAMLPGEDKSGFLFLINWNTNREFLNGWPVGGIAYRYQRDKSDNLKLVLGFPYSGVRWKATDRLQINAEYEFPRTVHTRVDYLCGRGVRLYGGFDWTNERFALHDRMEKADRLFYYEKRLTAGLRWDINEHMFIDASGGWAFDRFFFEGRGYQDRDDNRLDIKDGPFIGLTFGWQL